MTGNPSVSAIDAAEERRSWRAFGVASASIFMFVLDAGLISVALPEIERAFPESSRATISWASTGYLVSVAGFMLVAGRLGDVYGRKRIFDLGLIGLGGGAVLAGLAPTIGLLIAARMVQGVGAALVTATGLTLVLSDIAVARRPFAIGLWGSVGSIAAVIGPTLGAFVVDVAGWRVAVSLLAPICLITYLAGRSTLRETLDLDADGRIDPIGVLLATVGIGAVALSLSQSRVWGWSDPRTSAVLVIGLLLVGAFLERSRRSPDPVLDLRLFANRSFSGATLSAGLQQLGFFSWFFSTSFVLREVWGWSVRETGYAISLTFAFSATTGWLGGRAAMRFGYFWPIAISALVTAAGPIYWWLVFDDTPSFWSVYLPGAILFGLGGGACGVLTTGAALRNVDESDQGMAYAAHQTTRRVASSLGLALMASLLGEATGAALLDGARNVWLMVAAVHVLMITPLLGVWREDRA